MAKTLTITVPDDVADRLAALPDPSEVIARAVRGETLGEEVRRRHREAGFEVPEVEIGRAGRNFDALMAKITPEFRAEAEEFAAKVRARHPDVFPEAPSALRNRS